MPTAVLLPGIVIIYLYYYNAKLYQFGQYF